MSGPRPDSATRLRIFLDCGLLFLLAAALVWPLFRLEYLDNWMSIEGSFIADARFIRDHFPHPKWHALWYNGTRFDYVYPPLTRFGSAIASMLFRVIPAQGYHIYIATMYCVGIAGVYFLASTWTGRRWTSWLAALASALLSPVFLVFASYREDAAYGMPLRLNVLVKWGEGPHMSAFALLPFALAFLYLALKRRSLQALLACSLATAMVVSNNFYGAVALAIFFPFAVWAIWVGDRGRSVWTRSAAIVALAYGMCAWWLTPSFVALTARNLMLVAPSSNVLARAAGFVAVMIFCAVSWRFARHRRDPEWAVFLTGALLFFAMEVVAFTAFGFAIVGAPHRFLPELDLLLILAAVEAVRRLASIRRWAAIAVVAIAFAFSVRYLSNAWRIYPADKNPVRRVEYRLTEWIAGNLPGSRTFATGSLRLWYSAWRDIAELSGGSDQGMQSLMPSLAQWQVTMGNDPARDIQWMIATGCDAIIAHERDSREVYHHIIQPRKFMGRLPVIYDRDGDIIYRVPRRYPGLARIVSEARMSSLPPIPWTNDNLQQLGAYVYEAEQSSVQVDYRRLSLTEMRLRAPTQPGESILVQETWDPGWRAYDRGAPLEIRKDILDFMRLQTRPGDHDIRLVYDWPLESRIGQGFTLFTLLLVAFLAFRAAISRATTARPATSE